MIEQLSKYDLVWNIWLLLHKQIGVEYQLNKKPVSKFSLKRPKPALMSFSCLVQQISEKEYFYACSSRRVCRLIVKHSRDYRSHSWTSGLIPKDVFCYKNSSLPEFLKKLKSYPKEFILTRPANTWPAISPKPFVQKDRSINCKAYS
jgi:hypothetical protein